MNDIDRPVLRCKVSHVMKFSSFGIIPVSIALAACGGMNAPLTSSSSFDPLTPPGSGRQAASSSYGPELSPGQFVTANISNTAFYKAKPKANQDADKLLKQGTQMKIVSTDSSYVKVELDSGEVGYVPAVMVSSAAGSTPEILPLDGAYQVYPPLPGGGPLEPLPIIDPGGLPPDGSIPAIIDPDAPILTTPIPTLDPIPDLKPTEPKVEPKMEAPKELDPVAEEVRKKVEAAMAEEAKAKEAGGALKETPKKAE